MRRGLDLVSDGVLCDGVLCTFQDLVDRLPWRSNSLAPHEPRMPPHQYVLRSTCGDDLAFEALRFVVKNHPDSYDAYFRAYKYPNRYLELGGWRYWPSFLNRKAFLNRCRPDSVEPPRRVDEGAEPIPLEEWGASQPYWPRDSGYGEWRKVDGLWVFFPQEPEPRQGLLPGV